MATRIDRFNALELDHDDVTNDQVNTRYFGLLDFRTAGSALQVTWTANEWLC